MSTGFGFDTNTFTAAKIGEAINEQIYNKLYEDPEAAIREIISNDYDAYNDPRYLPNENKGLVRIEIDTRERILRFIDYGTGIIVPVDEFKMISYDTQEQAKKAADLGEFHMGKTSALKLCNIKSGKMPMVVFRSNNNKEGRVIPMVYLNNKIGYLEGYRYENPEQGRPEIGLTTEVYDLDDDMLEIDNVVRIVQKYFSILIKRRKLCVKIRYVHDGPEIEIPHIAGLETDGEIKRPPFLQTSKFGWLTTCLKPDFKPKSNNIDIYHKYVFVKTFHVEFFCSGWINCDDFRWNLAKDGLLTGPGTVYADVMKRFHEQYLPKFFEKQHYKESRLTHEKDMNKLYEDIIAAALPTFNKEMTDLLGIENQESEILGIAKEVSDKQGQMQVLEEQELTKDTGNRSGTPAIPIGPGHRGPGPRGKDPGTGPGIKEGGDHAVLIPKEQDPKERKHKQIKPNLKIVRGHLGSSMPECWVNDKWEMVLNEDRKSIQVLLTTTIQRRLSTLRYIFVAATVEAFTKERARPLSIIEYRNMCSDIFSRSFS